MTAQDRAKVDASEVIGSARAIEKAAHEPCRATVARPGLAPADVDVVLAHLAAAAGALPQAARQLSDILDQARRSHRLAMDELADATDPDIATDTARAHLGATREPALLLYRHLNAAHQHTAHIATVGDELGAGTNAPRETSIGRRAGDREPPRTLSAEHGLGVSR